MPVSGKMPTFVFQQVINGMTARMIKYVFALILSGLFLISTSGIMVYFHHCHHNQETFTSLFIDFGEMESHPCSGCSAEKPVSCCSPDGCPAPTEEPVERICLEACCIESSVLVRYLPDSEPPQHSRSHIKPACLHLPGLESEARPIVTEVDMLPGFSHPPEKPTLQGRQLVILHGRIHSDLI
jgi:hypothetical protein